MKTLLILLVASIAFTVSLWLWHPENGSIIIFQYTNEQKCRARIYDFFGPHWSKDFLNVSIDTCLAWWCSSLENPDGSCGWHGSNKIATWRKNDQEAEEFFKKVESQN